MPILAVYLDTLLNVHLVDLAGAGAEQRGVWRQSHRPHNCFVSSHTTSAVALWVPSYATLNEANR
jgi:hypothetical protein